MQLKLVEVPLKGGSISLQSAIMTQLFYVLYYICLCLAVMAVSLILFHQYFFWFVSLFHWWKWLFRSSLYHLSQSTPVGCNGTNVFHGTNVHFLFYILVDHVIHSIVTLTMLSFPSLLRDETSLHPSPLPMSVNKRKLAWKHQIIYDRAGPNFLLV